MTTLRTSAVASGSAVTTDGFVLREVTYPPSLRQERHAHSVASLTLVLAGSIRERAGSREELGSALSVVVKPSGVIHADEVGIRGARTLQIVFDETVVPSLTAEDAGLGCWRWLHAAPAVQGMLNLLRLVRQPSGPPESLLDDGIAETIAMLRPEPRAGGEPPRWLRIVQEALDDRLLLNPPVRELAALAGTHPVSLSRAFRRHYGCTITAYRQRERLRRAASAIDGAPHDISRIAHQSGFTDHPHLCREFREATGMTPTAFRALARQGSPMASSPES